NVTLDGDDTLVLEINGTSPTFTAGSDYDQIAVNGTVDLGGASLVIDPSSSISANPGESVRIIDNNLLDGVTNTFAGLPQFATLTINSQLFEIFYNGGDDGNDVVLTRIPSAPPANVMFVDDSWSIYSNGTDADNSNIPAANWGTTPGQGTA